LRLTGVGSGRFFSRRLGQNDLTLGNEILSNPGLDRALNETTDASNHAGSETERLLRPDQAQKFH
jgi:hypothetical protein